MRPGSVLEVEEWLESHVPAPGGAPGALRHARLERMRRLLSFLGNPEGSFRCVHVAGSKGKGSTARFISAAIAAGGTRTGLYLSPHLSDTRERFTLDGAFPPDDLYLDVAGELMDDVARYTEKYGTGERPTTFELYTCLAYRLFGAMGCEWAVIETGLGGRLDATNTIMPEASVITPIEFEHTSVLGGTIEEIAAEKSKIIKKGRPVAIGLLRPEAKDVMLREALAQGSEAWLLEREISSISTRTTAEGEVCSIRFRDGWERTLGLSMLGEVQASNAALAVMATRKLGLFTPGKSEAAIEKATLPGRFERRSFRGVEVILDVSHTKESVRHAVSSFKALHPDMQNACCLFGAIEGKDVDGMLRAILAEFPSLVIAKPSEHRKSDSSMVYERARELGGGGKTIIHEPDAAKALERAAAPGGPVLVTGSFYLACLIEGQLE